MSAPWSNARAPTGVGDGVVEDQRQAGRVGGLRPRRDVDDVELRVADRLGEDELRVLVGELRDGVGVVRVGQAHLDAVLRQRVREEVVGAAVELADGDDVVAGARDVQHRVGHGRLAGRGDDGADAALEVGEALLEHAPRRVHDPRVDVARDGEREEVGGVLRVVEDVRGRLVDRDRAGVGGRVRLLAAVKGDGLGPGLVVAHGGGSWVARASGGAQNTRTPIGKRQIARAAVRWRASVVAGRRPTRHDVRTRCAPQPMRARTP